VLGETASMDQAYNIEAWKDYAIMVGGASAALAGMLIVALTINIEEIVRFAYLPRRAMSALVVLMTPLIVAVLVLVPGQSDEAVGIELAVFASLVGVVLFRQLGRYDPDSQRTREQWYLGICGPFLLAVAALLLAGVGLATGAIGGLLWLVPFVIAAIVGGTAQVWVLLVEVRR